MRKEVKFDIPPGTNKDICKGCSAWIYWIRTNRGSMMPVDPDGTSHFATCPNAQRFRKRKEGCLVNE